MRLRQTITALGKHTGRKVMSETRGRVSDTTIRQEILPVKEVNENMTSETQRSFHYFQSTLMDLRNRGYI